eukprot:CAMPEP_0194222360 /NCGR_PEP_ID=MMETSP0156-20130528/32756_1 /TAXON_ID=33649 /ORGANISM="Thalassionema nitzschioides, Strain L26-B" /LENGTH=811 /DNA_ID=CAMNT_0038953123 /DNA_START=158 /DNA_END=2593 /DNA_ORIENTATION=+
MPCFTLRLMTVLTRLFLISIVLSATAAQRQSSPKPGLCVVAMITSDSDAVDLKDHKLSQKEYLNLIHKLFNETHQCETYEDLPTTLQDIFEVYSTQSQSSNTTAIQDPVKIYIGNVLPGDVGNEEQNQLLLDLCLAMHEAIQHGVGSSCNTVPTAIPIQSISTYMQSQPTVSTLQCFSAFSAADDDEDSFIVTKEYVTFVNRLSDDEYTNFTFLQLPEVIKTVFYEASTDNVIDVSNSTPGSQPSMEQLKFLREVCDDTGAAIASALSPSTSPTSFNAALLPTMSPTFVSPSISSSPTDTPKVSDQPTSFEVTESPTSSPMLSSSPTLFSSQDPTSAKESPVPVQSSLPTRLPIDISSMFPTLHPSLSSFSELVDVPVAFIVSSRNSSTVSASDRSELVTAFNQMCSTIVKDKDSGPVYVTDSAFIDEIRETKCQEAVLSGTFCHAVYFVFNLRIENANIAEDIQQEFSDAAQIAITVGELDTKNLNIEIGFGFIPSRVRSGASDNEETNFVLIAGTIAAFLAFIILLVVIWYLVKRREEQEKNQTPPGNKLFLNQEPQQNQLQRFDDEYDNTGSKRRPAPLLSLDAILEDLSDEDSIDPNALSEEFFVVAKDKDSGLMGQALHMSSLNQCGPESSTFMEMSEQNGSPTVAESSTLNEQNLQSTESLKPDLQQNAEIRFMPTLEEVTVNKEGSNLSRNISPLPTLVEREGKTPYSLAVEPEHSTGLAYNSQRISHGSSYTSLSSSAPSEGSLESFPFNRRLSQLSGKNESNAYSPRSLSYARNTDCSVSSSERRPAPIDLSNSPVAQHKYL